MIGAFIQEFRGKNQALPIIGPTHLDAEAFFGYIDNRVLDVAICTTQNDENFYLLAYVPQFQNDRRHRYTARIGDVGIRGGITVVELTDFLTATDMTRDSIEDLRSAPLVLDPECTRETGARYIPSFVPLCRFRERERYHRAEEEPVRNSEISPVLDKYLERAQRSVGVADEEPSESSELSNGPDDGLGPAPVKVPRGGKPRLPDGGAAVLLKFLCERKAELQAKGKDNLTDAEALESAQVGELIRALEQWLKTNRSNRPDLVPYRVFGSEDKASEYIKAFYRDQGAQFEDDIRRYRGGLG